jgi:Domain of Unknown Function with PDB structure (DUF3857)/Transglutaminase-like superfamily
MRASKLSICLFLLLAAAPAALAATDEAPVWLQQAAAVKVPSYDKEVPAVVLRNEKAVTIGEDGRVNYVTTYAVRILTRDGRGYAEATEMYLTNAGKVREMTAWLIRPNGFVKKYDKDETVDRINQPNDIYNEYRNRIIDASDDADIGVVFGYQASGEERPLFNQDVWWFQDFLPTLQSRYSLTLPAGWRANNLSFNHEKIEPTISGSTYAWELLNLAPITPEVSSPKLGNLAPRIAINYARADSGAGAHAKNFEDWSQVSRWASDLQDPQAVPDETVTAKARELTANSKTDLDRIRAIAHFVQRLQYISIDIGVGKGNGYRPHTASQVLAKAYGDCKDKANLMRSMLRALNITAYPIVIYSGDPTYVREEWASPSQFNHCIIGIKVGDEIQAATVITHAVLGRLLIFDATDEHTTLGDLPGEEQGSLALIVAGESGSLVRMPTMPPESSQLNRQTEVELSPLGAITAKLKEKSTGQMAVYQRRAFRGLSSSQYKQMLEAWVTRGATSALVSRIEPVDNNVEGHFGLDVDFSADRYGQLMQNRLLVFNPAIVSRREALFLTEPKREHPIVLDSLAFTEVVHVKLPAGFEVDELPDAVKLDTPFGSYKTSYEVKTGELVFTRALTQRALTIPAAQYQAIRSFFERIRAAEQAPVVLARK